MGDNRGNSKDSRSFGVITKSQIVGRVFFRIWPLTRIDIM
jgi:signal peptidase I